MDIVYKKTKYDFIKVGSDGEIYSTWKGLLKKKCSIRKGLKTFRIRVNKTKRVISVAKLVAEVFISNPNNYRYVLTKDGDEMNTSPDNLYWSKSNRMDYKAFSEKKKGMVYKAYVGKEVGCYTVIGDDTKECILECDECKDTFSIDRNSIKNKSISGVCDKIRNKLDIESLVPSAAFKNWEVIKEKGTENLPLNKKLLEIKCTCCKEKRTIKYNTIISATRKVNCTHIKKIRMYLQQKLKAMKQRCYNNNNPDYIRYGAKGIIVCEEWLNNSEKFISWSLENNFDFGKEIDRINNNKGYSPTNCQYLTKEEHIEKHKN